MAQSIINAVEGRVALAVHSYGGSVICVAANGNANVKGLERATELSGRLRGKRAIDMVQFAADVPVDRPV